MGTKMFCSRYLGSSSIIFIQTPPTTFVNITDSIPLWLHIKLSFFCKRGGIVIIPWFPIFNILLSQFKIEFNLIFNFIGNTCSVREFYRLSSSLRRYASLQWEIRKSENWTIQLYTYLYSLYNPKQILQYDALPLIRCYPLFKHRRARTLNTNR